MSNKDSQEGLPNDRTVVFISNIPLKAIDSSDVLKTLLRDVTTRCLRVLMLENEPYALALYASSTDALAACKADISVMGPDSAGPVKLRLRILKKPKATISEVFCDTIVVEGKSVSRDELAVTAGLQWANQARVLPKWCRATVEEEDCPMGIQCRFIHLAKFQQTIKKKRHHDELLSSSGGGGGGESSFTFRDIQALVPESLQLPRSKVGVVHLDCHSIGALLKQQTICHVGDDGGDSGEGGVGVEGIIAAVELEAGRLGIENPFVKLSVSGGAPVDWCLSKTSPDLEKLRALCPLPKSNISTPEERDVYFQKLLRAINTLAKFDTASQAVDALIASKRVRATLQSFLKQREKATSAGSDASYQEQQIDLIVMPWLSIPSLLHEVSIFVANGLITRVAQRYGMKYVPQSAPLVATSDASAAAAPAQPRPMDISKGILGKLILLQNFLQSDAMRKGISCCFDAVVTDRFDLWIISVHDYSSKADESEVFQMAERQQLGGSGAGGGSSATHGEVDDELPYASRFNTTTHQRFPHFSWDVLALLKN